MIEAKEAGVDNSRNGYNLSQEQVEKLTVDLLEDRPPVGDERYVCYMVNGQDRFSDIGRKIECDVFNEKFHNDPEEMEREYGPYEDASTFFISIDRENRIPTGVLRVIQNGSEGLKSLNDIVQLQDDFSIEEAVEYHGIDSLDECWDLGTVAVPRQFRSAQGGVSLQVYRGMYVASQNAGIKHFVSIIDKGPYDKMTKFLGFPFVSLHGAESFEYLGSAESIPVYGDAPKFEDAVRRKKWTIRGMLARKALGVLTGARDNTLQFGKNY